MGNAAGPDTMALYIKFRNKNAISGHLDVYKEIFRKTAYQRSEIRDAAVSLGRSYREINYPCPRYEDERKKNLKEAIATNACLKKFAKLLSRKFGDINIKLRDRVIVIKQSASDLKDKADSWLHPCERGVKVWTTDFLEPTFSTIDGNKVKIEEESKNEAQKKAMIEGTETDVQDVAVIRSSSSRNESSTSDFSGSNDGTENGQGSLVSNKKRNRRSEEAIPSKRRKKK